MNDLDTIAINDMRHELCDNEYTKCRECFIKGRHLCETWFDTYEMAKEFIDTLNDNPRQFEGIRVREYGYSVDSWERDYDDREPEIEGRDECNTCGRTEYMCPGH